MMSSSKDEYLYGTTEPTRAGRRLECGALSCTLVNGALHLICYHGWQAVKQIALIVRDAEWGTCIPEISAQRWQEDGAEIVYTQEGEVSHGRGKLHLRLEYRIGPEEIHATAVIEGVTPFATTRTGFNVLHPLDGLVDAPVKVTHTDGTEETGRFPQYISPSQPFFNIRSLSYELPCGTSVTCTMTGDAYEMEDQRNWTDASYKTYIRPLSKPRPYRIDAGETLEQAVHLTFAGSSGATQSWRARQPEPTSISLQPGDSLSPPELGIGYFAWQNQDIANQHDALQTIQPTYVEATLDLRNDLETQTRAIRAVVQDTHVPLWLRAIVPDSDTEAIESSLRRLATLMADSGLSMTGITALPAAYLKSYQPTEAWPTGADPEDAIRACRAVFPDARIGGGMFTYFTELNRCRPPERGIDFITHATAAIVHAADDRSVMETLDALPDVFASAQKIAGGKSYRIGTSSIATWTNPNGDHLVANKGRQRIPLTDCDPRQAALFGAAWHLGYYAKACHAGVDALALATLGWPFPVATGQDVWTPVFHVLKGLSAAKGHTLCPVRVTGHAALAGVAWRSGDAIELWAANLTPERQEVRLLGCALSRVVRLNVDTFESARYNSNFMDVLKQSDQPQHLFLSEFEIIRALLTPSEQT